MEEKTFSLLLAAEAQSPCQGSRVVAGGQVALVGKLGRHHTQESQEPQGEEETPQVFPGC